MIKPIYLLLFFFGCIVLTIGCTKTPVTSNNNNYYIPVASQDSIGLVSLFNSTNGNNWKSRFNWLNGPVSTWGGVTITNGRVTDIVLANNNLVGPISPTFIDSLTGLISLNLSYNLLTGNLPTFTTKNSSLQQLILQGNNFSGQIPVSIANLYNLLYLNFNNNQLSDTIPNAISALTSLQSLSLSNNKLIGPIPKGLYSLTKNLATLDLSNNNIKDTINPLIQGMNLTSIKLNNNQLYGSIANVINEIVLMPMFNKNSIYPFSYLNLSYNQFSDTLPISFGQLGQQIPVTGGVNYVGIGYLNLSNNNIIGTIPNSVGGMQELLYLDLSFNQLTGNIPDQLWGIGSGYTSFPLLNQIYLNNNKLTGSLSSAIINLSYTSYLYLNNNQLTGTIPSAIMSIGSQIQGGGGLYQGDFSGNTWDIPNTNPAVLSYLQNRGIPYSN